MKKYFALITILAAAVVFVACGDDPAPTGNAQGNSQSGSAPVANENVGPETQAAARPNDTPTEAYKRLFAAVKSKNSDAIKAEFSRGSIAAAQSQAAQAKVPVAEVYKNGFTATTFADKLPEMRDERVRDNMAALEVWNARDKIWEDLPFIREASGWKLAVGDVLANTWKRPSLGRAAREKLAANATSGTNGVTTLGNANANQFGKPGNRK